MADTFGGRVSLKEESSEVDRSPLLASFFLYSLGHKTRTLHVLKEIPSAGGGVNVYTYLFHDGRMTLKSLAARDSDKTHGVR